MKTSKSPRTVLLVAYAIGLDVFDAYAHPCSPKKFTQPQLFACLVLKTFFNADYRGIVHILNDLPGLCQTIGLETVPHYTTLQKAARRLLCEPRSVLLLNTTVRWFMQRRKQIQYAAIDSSGFDTTHASRYYVWRAKRMGFPRKHMTYRRFGKLSLICDCHNHLIVAAMTCRGPTPDVNQLQKTFARCSSHVSIQRLVADAGYDSESNHVFLREQLRIRSVIPPKHGRPSKDGKPPSGRYRRMMKRSFDRTSYKHRSQIETVFSMIKRNLGSCLSARSYWSKNREMNLKVITHNIMIVYDSIGFLQSECPLYSLPPCSLRFFSFSALAFAFSAWRRACRFAIEPLAICFWASSFNRVGIISSYQASYLRFISAMSSGYCAAILLVSPGSVRWSKRQNPS